MFKIIKEYWDIFGGTIFAFLITLLAKFELNTIQLIYSILILWLLCVGALRLVKPKKDKRKKPNLVDEVVDHQKPMQALNLAENPTEQGEKLYYLSIKTLEGARKTMEKIKKIFKWLWTYKEQVVGLLGTFIYACMTAYMFILDKFGWLLKYFPQTQGWEIGVKIVVGIGATIAIVVSARNQIKWVGVGSLSTAIDYLQEKANQLVGGLSKENRAKLHSILSTAKKSLNQSKKVLNSAQNSFNTLQAKIKSQKDFIAALSKTSIDQSVITSETAELGTLQSQLTTVENELVAAKALVEKFEKQVNECQKQLNA